MTLGRFAIFFMFSMVLAFVAAMCQNDEDASMTFSVIASLAIAFLITFILAENGVV